MSATQDFVALDWIRGEIAQTLDRAQQALETASQQPDDTSSMRSCLTSIHQVHGTLKMVELTGPTRLAAEMEELAQALMNNAVPDVANAQEVLMQAILQMGGFLDRVHRDQEDKPEEVIPVANSLRVARGAERLETEDTDAAEESGEPGLMGRPADDESVAGFEARGGASTVTRLRQRYQHALVSLIRRKSPRENLNQLGRVFANLTRLCGRSPVGYLAQISVAVIEGVAGGGIKLDGRIVNSLKQVDKMLKRLVEDGVPALSEPVPEEISRPLLDAVENSSRETSRIKAVRELFSREPETSQDSGWVSMGPDDETVSAVARILKDELTAITDKLDLYVRSANRSQQDLVDLLPMLEQISATMSVVGLTAQQKNVHQQAEVIRGIETSGQAPDEETLLDMARTLLHIESLLDAMAGDGEGGEEADHFGNLDEAQASVIRETRSGLAPCKDAVIEFVASEWDHDKIGTVPDDLRALRGGLQIVNQERAANILLACARYVEDRLLADNRVPDLAEMDHLADAITSVDYYLERLLESSTDPYLQMMEVAEAAIARLGFDADHVVDAEPDLEEGLETAVPDTAEVEAPAEPAEATPTEEEATPVDEEPEEITDELEEALEPESEELTTPAEEVTAGEATGEDAVELVDDEIVEIFGDEADEVLEAIREFFPRWRSNRADNEALTEVRRAFHTLKGSGRMVGAEQMGELAWSVENMLNQVIEGSIEVNEDIMALIDEVVDKIPEGVEAFREGAQERFAVNDLIERANTFADGEARPGPTETTDPASEVPATEEIEPGEVESLDVADVSLEEVEPEEIGLETGSTGDPELDEIFVTEASEHLDVVRSFVDNPQKVDSSLVSAFHTLKGSAGMADINTVPRVAAPLETLASQIYLQREGVPDESFVSLTREGLRLMDQVVGDLDHLRYEQPGLEEFVRRAGQLLAGLEETPAFDFREIRELADPSPILTNWDGARVEGVVTELSYARDQARTLGYEDLQALVESMLRIYEQLIDEPADEVVESLSEAHETLVAMFDQIAAGQDIDPCPEVIEKLDAIDVAVLEADKESQYFLKDCWEALGDLDAAIQRWQSDIANLKPVEQIGEHLSRLELHAESRQASAMIALLEEMIRLCEAISANELTPDEADPRLLEEGRQALIEQLEQIKERSEAELDEDALARFRERVDIAEPAARTFEQAEPAAEPPPAEVTELPRDKVDEDVLPIFLEEADELLEQIDQSILDWSGDTASTEYLDNLLRHLHTLKGGSRLAGLASLGEYTHNLETWLIGVKQNPPALDDQFFGLLNRRQDEITRRVEIYKKLVVGEATDEELASLTTVVESTAPAATEAAPAELSEAQAAQPAAPKEHARQEQKAQPQEVVRVSAELLDDLISLVGESSITRARIEQQISDFGESLEEMEQTINRVREHVRRLEMETESRQALLRTQSEEGDSGFDELEMDRYTMLQEISRALSEGASDMLDLKDTLSDKARDAETLLHQQARIGGELQEGLTRTTMVPFARLIPRLRRIVRQVSNEIGKSVRFDAYNVEGELDRTVLERIVAPLEHMLRNAVDHGIEALEERKARNKPETGRISLRLSRDGAFVVLKISDDGAGIDVDALRAKAIERGLMSEDSPLSDHDVMQFVMHAGLSTAKKVTQISGRGVGMDVVDSELKQLGGSLTIDSTQGVGTEFTVRLPFTVSINRALMVVVGEETYAVPLNTIEGIVRVSPYELEAYYQPDAPMFEYAGQPYRLVYMGKLLDKLEAPDLEGQIAPLPIILARSGDNAVALHVDRVIGSREVVVKALGPQFNDVPGVSGATVLGDGSVVVILDVMALVRNEAAVTREQPTEQPTVNKAVRTVMIVDDSVTVRKVTSRLMERQGWEVVTAKDGVEAVNQLQEMYPDIVLLDIEMPRMDGFEVLSSIRRDDRLKDLPVIMITSRTGEKHKQQALDLGVDSYLGKPFQEANLFQTIEEVLAARNG